mgnify:CR=1 FL=1
MLELVENAVHGTVCGLRLLAQLLQGTENASNSRAAADFSVLELGCVPHPFKHWSRWHPLFATAIHKSAMLSNVLRNVSQTRGFNICYSNSGPDMRL